MRGVIVVTETMLTIGSLVVGIILLVVVFSTVFSHQATSVEDTALISLARSLEVSIDRVAASASSSMVTHEFPDSVKSGVNLRVFLDQKGMEITFLDTNRSVKRSFAASMHIDQTYSFDNPQKLCLIKSRNDGKIYVSETCACNYGDGICDPSCLLYEKCDPECYGQLSDNVCDSRCVKSGDGICDPDCYRNQSDATVDSDCIKPGDGICDPDTNNKKDNICDPDCAKDKKDNFCDPDCSSNVTGICDPDCSPDDKCNGVCDTACSKENGICDPDCPDDPDCWLCAKENESCSDKPCCYKTLCGREETLTCCPGAKTCVQKNSTCCGNNYCEISPFAEAEKEKYPYINFSSWGFKSEPMKWENFYTCEQDCGNFSMKESCPEKNGCNCSIRIDAGTWTSTPCVSTIVTQTQTGTQQRTYQLNWTPDALNVCNRAVIDYLNRRGWDINEIAKDLTAEMPNGFAFDNSIYLTGFGASCFIQNARDTITTNENYVNERFCCCSTNNCAFMPPPGAFIQEECKPTPDCGTPGKSVGICMDHSTAVVSIMRTLGIPKDHVYAFYIIGLPAGSVRCPGHGIVAYLCNHTLDENMILKINGERCVNETWYIIDATSHIIRTFDEFKCSKICSWWNDHGLYNGTVITYPEGLQCGDFDPNNYKICNTIESAYCIPQDKI
ncbi:MAG: hypothetical protein V1900_02060 [Candidatus Aenigmatarchaeota archaeon]